MHDEDTVQRLPLREIVEATRPLMSWSQRLQFAVFLKFNPDAVQETTLCELSDLVGSIDGDKIQFTKTYREPQRFVIFSKQGKRVVEGTIPIGSILTYSGTILGNVIEGKWQIDAAGIGISEQGSFRLNRVK